MVRLFDSTFLVGTLLVIAALGVAFAAVTRDDLPLIGAGTGALLAVTVIGMAGCAVGGISQASAMGWTSPAILIGTILGVVALATVAAGLFGWTIILQPIASLVPAQATAPSPARIATFALAGMIAVKWLIAAGMAAIRLATE